VQGDDGVAARIMEMGLIDGEEIELLGRAPLGDPLEFFVQGYRVSLRVAEARRVAIEPLSPNMTSYGPDRQAPPR
jgi:ferrous iron transport protein A